jgi:hypothetical protein
MSGAIKYKEAYRKGDYILNHYCRNSHKDKLCLSRSLHKWAIEYAKRAADTMEQNGHIAQQINGGAKREGWQLG